MEHPIIITLDMTGGASLIYHPTKQADVAEALTEALGLVTEDRRGGYVLPAAPLKRWAFRALRRLFGDASTVADWTRAWAGPWVVIRADNGEALPGTFPTHAAAVEAEVAYILKEMI